MVQNSSADSARAFAEELRKYWSFNDMQRHTHSWHSREDFIEKKLPKLLAALSSDGDVAARANAGKQMIAAGPAMTGTSGDTTQGDRPAATVKVRPSEAERQRQMVLTIIKLEPIDQFRIASLIAENVGYVLVRGPDHPDSPHSQEAESISHYVENYRFEFEDGRSYTPNDQDKALLEDAIEGFRARLELTPQPVAVAQGQIDRDTVERCYQVVLEERCQRGTPWDLACTTIARKLLGLIGESSRAPVDVPIIPPPAPSSWQPIETKLRNALEKIAAKNDLSGIPDDELQSAAFGALHECECIARNALAVPSTHRAPTK